jgi:ADP-heptose:LPS heptosyltransferase
LVTAKCALPPQPLKVLFHITGGVPIKNYPQDDAKVVCRSLAMLGIDVSVIGRPDLEAFGAHSVEADETDLLSEAVHRHHIFVGLDSFPHHFVRNVMGWPTIGLFGTTTATNFGGGWNTHYRSLDASLPCHPCGAERDCPVFGRAECSNYIKPQTLIATILEMAQQVYGFTA